MGAGRHLEVPGASTTPGRQTQIRDCAATANGTPVELWTCNGGSHQQWSLS
nr:hypothetical protein [Streptomyces sp. NBRC 110028]